MSDFVDACGLKITYRRAGRGKPLVFLHGSPGDSRTWTPQMEGLADEFTVIAWDMPGFGGSDDPPETFSLAEYADCAAAFIRGLGLDGAHIAGLSFGGGLAIELYHRHPKVVNSLILVGAYAGWAGSLRADVMEQRRALYHHLSELRPDEFLAELLPTMFTPSTPTETADIFGRAILGTHPVSLRVTSRAFAEADLRDVLPTIAVPTLLIYGDHDIRAPLEVANGLHAGIVGSELVVVEGAGHIVNIDTPDRFNAEMRLFLRSLPG